MGGAIHGAGQNPGHMPQVTGDKQAVKELTMQLADMAQDVFESLQDLSNELGGKVAIKDPNKASKQEGAQQLPAGAESEEATAEMAGSVSAQDELEKKKKRKKLDEKLKTMGSILGQIDVSELDEADQKELETFQKNLNQLNTLNRKLNQLDREEEYLDGLLEQRSGG